jgi:uncharacterized repeat protein (TIGR01451 family)
MLPRRALIVSALVAVAFGPLAAAADQGSLKGNVEALRVVTQDNGRVVFLPADEARPQDILEYRVTYANTGETTLHSVTVVDPVPIGTEYIGRSATRPNEGAVEFSIDDGKTFHAWPIRIKKKTENGKAVEVEATPDMVTHIRWTISSDFEPESAITFSYRAIVK